MAVPTSSDPMGGKLSVTINNVTIPSFLIGSVSPSVKQVLRTSDRLSGSTTSPSNQLDNPSFEVVFYPNKWADLQYFMPDSMNDDNTALILGGSDCSIPAAVPVVLHYECEDDEDRDVSMPSVRVSFEDNKERNAADDLSVTIHIYPQPNAMGQIIYGPMPTS